MSTFKVDGLDDLQKQLKKMQEAAHELDGVHEYSFDELFPPAFMIKNTKYATIDLFLDNCGFPATTTEEFEAIPDAEFDVYVRKSTRFSSWEAMLEEATDEMVSRRLGLE